MPSAFAISKKQGKSYPPKRTCKLARRIPAKTKPSQMLGK